MSMDNYADYARSFGYGLRFTGIGMAYVTLNDSVLLTDAMDIDRAEKELMIIGMYIMADTIRNNLTGRV